MRDIDPSAQAYMESGHALMAALVFLDLASGPLRLNTSSITIPWDGHDWIGAGGRYQLGPRVTAPPGRG